MKSPLIEVIVTSPINEQMVGAIIKITFALVSLQLYSGCNNKLDREPYFCPSVDVKVGLQSSDQNSMGREKDFVPSLQQLLW